MGESNDARNQDRPVEQNHRGNRTRRRPEPEIPLDKGFNLLAGLHDEQKPSFGFCELDEPVIYGTAVLLGGSPRRLRTLHEDKASFDMIVDWRNEEKGA